MCIRDRNRRIFLSTRLYVDAFLDPFFLYLNDLAPLRLALSIFLKKVFFLRRPPALRRRLDFFLELFLERRPPRGAGTLPGLQRGDAPRVNGRENDARGCARDHRTRRARRRKRPR